MRNLTKYLAAILPLVIIVLGGGWWFLATSGEREKPTIKFAEDVRSIGRQKTLNLTFADNKAGLRHIAVSLTQDNKPHILASTDFPQKGIKQKPLSLTVAPQVLKLHDGPATLSVAASDHSVFRNETALMRPVTIDLTPPQIYLLTPTNNINPGGSCVIAYRTSEPTVMSGVQVDKNFSSGYPAVFSGKQANVTYFGLPMVSKGEGLSIRVFGRDAGDNETSVGLPSLIRKKKFRSDKMNLTDNFINRVAQDFQPLPPEIQGKPPFEAWLYINSTMRLANETHIRELCRQSVPQQLWEGTFLRMKNASPMAQFGDQRTYVYNKQVVGESVHNGVDLASLANSPVEASNNGIVKFTGNLGIYGNTVLIDHGQGIFSIYGHLSAIDAKIGQHLKKGEVIGKTGTTGLAVGDHLHFGMLAGGQFVNPVEWWDPHWIADNVTNKLTGL